MRRPVALARCGCDAARPYPDFPYRQAPSSASPQAAIESCFALLGLDRANARTPRWNPLGEVIRPGQQVLIKPNWAMHRHAWDGDVQAVITHGSVLGSVLHYVVRALEGHGKVTIGDAPIQSADFDLLMQQTRTPQLAEEFRSSGIEIAICDFRQNVCRFDASGRLVEHIQRPTGETGCTVDMGKRSFLEEVSDLSSRFRVTNYDPSAMGRHHQQGRHEYLLAQAALDADVILHVPKLKTHRKAGLTCCLKGVVGINASKDYLPHHRTGSLRSGGDEYLSASAWKAMASRITDALEAHPGGLLRAPGWFALRACRKLASCFASDPFTEGSWHGNDTIWRTVLDLNHVQAMAGRDGSVCEQTQRRLFYVVDAILAGDGEGPLAPNGVHMGAVLAGFDAAAIDACAARLVGLDERKIPLLQNALALAGPSGETSQPVLLDAPGHEQSLEEIQPIVRFRPPSGWAGHVELDGMDRASSDARDCGQCPGCPAGEE